jgi:hypothetical protein
VVSHCSKIFRAFITYNTLGIEKVYKKRQSESEINTERERRTRLEKKGKEGK